jgi:hypothetical protein
MRQIQTTILISAQGGEHQAEATFLFAPVEFQGSQRDFLLQLDFRVAGPQRENFRFWSGFPDKEQIFITMMSWAMAGGRSQAFAQNFLGPFAAQRRETPGAIRVYREFAQYLLEADIVFESSPPQVAPFSELLGKASWVTVGSLVGVHASGGSPLLMIISVPIGIIIVGTAVGVATGLQKGLARRIEKAIDRTSGPHV